MPDDDLARLRARYDDSPREAPPAPPWDAFPDLHPYDIGWRMGAGEAHMARVTAYLHACGAERLAEYRHSHLAPPDWQGWYEQNDDL